MSGIPAVAPTRFARLALALAGGDATKLPFREGRGTGSFFVGKKMFALLDESGAVVLKLPPARVQELIASGIGAGWHPGTGAPLKEHVAVGVNRQSKWLALAKESRGHMASKR